MRRLRALLDGAATVFDFMPSIQRRPHRPANYWTPSTWLDVPAGGCEWCTHLDAHQHSVRPDGSLGLVVKTRQQVEDLAAFIAARDVESDACT